MSTHSNAREIITTTGVTGPRDRAEHASCAHKHIYTQAPVVDHGGAIRGQRSQVRELPQKGHEFAEVSKSERLRKEVRRVRLTRNPFKIENTPESEITDKLSST